MATKKKSRSVPETKDELIEQAEIDEELLRPGAWEADWKLVCDRENFNLWERLDAIPAANQGECHAYLYRLFPVVRNSGPYTNIEKYTFPPMLTLEGLKADHGGGKFNLKLKRGGGKFSRTLGDWTFSVEGAPRYKEGQTDASGKVLAVAPATAAESRGSELAEALKALVPLLRNDSGQKATDATIEVMKTGMTSALSMQRDAAGAPNELLTKLVDRALTQPTAQDPLALLDKIISISKNFLPQSPANNPNGLEGIDSQLSFVEKITGKSFSELLTPEGRAPKIDPWVGVLGALVQVLPGALREFRQMQFERMQWQAHLASKGIALSPPPNLPAQPATEVPPPTSPNQPPSTDQAQPQPTLEQITAAMVNEIVRYRRGGWDGHACAAALAVNYAEVLPILAPMLSDRNQVEAFIVQTPALNVLINEVVHPEAQSWSEFVDDFFWTLNPDQAPEDEDDDDNQPETPEPADAVQTRTRKKKPAVVGRVV